MIYFFDDQSLDACVNFSREYGIPEYIPEATYKDPTGYAVSPGFPNVFFSEKLNEYIMLYNLMEPDTNPELNIFICAAHSKDMVHWQALDTGKLTDIPNRKLFNQIFPETCGEGYFYEDTRAVKEERYKIFYCRYAPGLRVKCQIYVSGDLFTWKKLDSTWNPQGAEPGLGCFYSSVLKEYVITCRPHWADRRVCITTTKDFRSFTPLRQMLTTDSMDENMTEAYGMPCFEYNGIYIGFLWKYFRPKDSATIMVGNQLINNAGRLQPELVYSKSGQYFQRSLRRSFIPKNDPSMPYYGCLYPTALIPTDDGVRIFASCSQGEHYGFRSVGVGSIVSFRLKKDRFICLEGNAGAMLRTRMLLINGALTVNANVSDHLQCRLIDKEGNTVPGFGYDEFDVIKGDHIDTVLTWHGKDTSCHKGKAYRLEISLLGGRIYTIGGDFSVLAFNQHRLYEEFGTVEEEIL